MNNYLDIIIDILENEQFKKLSNYSHHGDNRKNHCIRVSYYSYKISKKLNLDYESVARAGLLHDFFLVDYKSLNILEGIKLLINHPKIALNNSKNYFDISKKEENIIYSHMFPIRISLPKNRESIIVNFVDKSLAFYERFQSIKNTLINKENKTSRLEELYNY